MLTYGLYLPIFIVLLHLLLSTGPEDEEDGMSRVLFIVLGLWNAGAGVLTAVVSASADSGEVIRMLSIYLGAAFATLLPALAPGSVLNTVRGCLTLVALGGLLGASLPYLLR